MTHVVTTFLRIPDTARAEPVTRQALPPRNGFPSFLSDKVEKIKRAGLGRFAGVAPPPPQERLDALREQARQAGVDDPETRQAKDIYQAMLDVTSY